MACSVCAVTAFAGSAAAQIMDPPPPNAPIARSRYSPAPTNVPSTLPQRPANIPPAPPPLPPAYTSSTRTLHFTKDMTSIKQASAALATPVAAQDAKPKDDAPAKMGMGPGIKIDDAMPSRERLFRLDTEEMLIQRENAERRVYNKTVKKDEEKKELGDFPKQGVISTSPYLPRSFAQMAIETEPHYLCHGRLFFEAKNSERYGWDLGPIQPLVCAAHFVGDVWMLPYKVCSFPHLRYDCSAGKCLPGDSVPLYVYPPGLSVTGGLAEAGVIVALHFIFP